ncbi:alcohol dehydrogenase [Podospora aff. communis PSN243]|uniref:Alcohol dehydrogenase n=1 Tax=Podospora aff. communis PSN243 TaxID=3040156 RepID=A0AAV9H560_9PEZI|nr:alcohol dehydrogenase [Podospora aff. communis PSN243]
MQSVLQAGLATGMSAVSGIHSSKPKWADHSLAGANLMPDDFCPDPESRIEIPTKSGTPVRASYLCVGLWWPWGDTATWNYTADELPAIKAAWDVLCQAGINFIDTAEAYASGTSEEIVGGLIKDLPRDSYVIQTKWLSTPMMADNFLHPIDAPVKSLRGSLERLGLEYVDIYLIHGLIHPQSIAHAAEGMAKCVELGLAKAIGVANYDRDDMLQMKTELVKYNIPLSVNQCEFNVLRRYPEISDEGVMKTCRAEGIIFQSYSSLAQSRLSGKHNVENPPPKTCRFSNYDMEVVDPIVDVLRKIGQQRGKNVPSVALNYNISKGALPLVGIKNPEQARDVVDALGWRLTRDEVIEIDKVSIEGKKTVLWQQG